MASTVEFQWRPFLERWSAEWLTLQDFRVSAPPDLLQTGWLGYAGETEEQLTQLERRLGRALPPSYQAFLRVSSGWRNTSRFITSLWSTHEVQWLSVRNQHRIDVWTAPDVFDGWEKRHLQ